MGIRRAVAGDAASMSALAIKAKQHWGYSQAQMDIWRQDLLISEEILASTHAYVLELDRRLVGFYVLSMEFSGASASAARDCVLEHLWVAPEHMRQGHGRALLVHACNMARRLDSRQIRIDADPYALNFYLACGAKQLGEIAAPIEGDPGRVRPQLALKLD
jgi:GNAT superfamily N-acetyltransferase